MIQAANPAVDEAADAIAGEEIAQALAQVLNSASFAKAPRVSQLLRFLVERAQQHPTRAVSAYTVALEVFGRTRDSFDPAIDATVRVQVGRLRSKLDEYYASEGRHAPLHFDIPVGSCRPNITRRATALPAPLPVIEFSPVKFIGLAAARRFGRGLNEQLIYELSRLFGSCIELRPASSGRACSRLEGSLRVEPCRARASMRLIDILSGRIVWAQQFDRDSDYSIRQQEHLALAICEALKVQLHGVAAS